MADDPAFIWDQRAAPPRRRPGPHPPASPATLAPPSTATDRPRERITLREAEHRFGVAVSTLRAWARKGAIDAAMEDGPAGRQWMATTESIAHHLSRGSRPATRTATASRRSATGPTGDGSAMLVPRDAWDKLLDQLGNLHEAGLLLAEARERAAKAETEATFLRERLADMRAERAGGAGADPGTTRRRWWRRDR